MKKINTSKISGTQELIPSEQAIFNNLKNKVERTFHQYGYLDIETPTIERNEILFAKAGGETEKQIYKIVKTSETAEESDQSLRFDHTVPLARYVVEHENDLHFPFKVAQVGLSFRGERAQKGRFREFYQCDIDIIGRGTLEIAYDADVIVTLLRTLESFNIKASLMARISNRKILSGLLEALNLTEKSEDIYSIIDHSEKVPAEKTKESFESIELDEKTIQKLIAFTNLHGERSFVIKNLNSLNIDNTLFKEGIAELDNTMYLLEEMGLKDKISADMKIVRGLDYYTGTVFEFILPEYRKIGSICGGGRYDNLTSYFTDQKFPGVGGSIGLTRLFYVLNEHNLLPDSTKALLDLAIIPITTNEQAYAFRIADQFRAKDQTVSVVLSDKKLGDKITYATKIAENGIVIGESEVSTGKLTVKNYASGETMDISLV